jgi:hypothetical protein
MGLLLFSILLIDLVAKIYFYKLLLFAVYVKICNVIKVS